MASMRTTAVQPVRYVPRSVTAIAMTSVVLGAVAVPASAHSGGKAVVLVRTFTIVPADTAWNAVVTLADLDSGAPLDGVDVKMLTGGATIPTTPTMVSGEYMGVLPKIKPGPLHLELKVATAPGGTQVEQFSKPYDTELVAGQTTAVSGGEVSGGSDKTRTLAGVGAVALLVVLGVGLFGRRRRGLAQPGSPA